MTIRATENDRTDRRGVAIAMEALESLGFAFREQKESDYGIDAHAELIESQAPTGRVLGLQIKSGTSYLSHQTDRAIVYRADAAHVDYWIDHALPVLILICDIPNRTVFWHPISRETALMTGKGYRFDIPIDQTLCASARPKLTDLLTPIASGDRFTIFKTDDVSHGSARRLSFRVVINGTASKSEIASIVRQVTTVGSQGRYFRGPLVESAWGDVDAHVVSTFVYPSAEDEARCNHICRSLWVSESLEESARPASFMGENIGHGIIVEWSRHYRSFAALVSANTMTKEAYLGIVIPVIEELRGLLAGIDSELVSLSAGEKTEASFLQETNAYLQRIDEIYMITSNFPYAPFECKSMDDVFNRLIAGLHNVFVYYSDRGVEKWTSGIRLKMSTEECRSAAQAMVDLEYELGKVR